MVDRDLNDNERSKMFSDDMTSSSQEAASPPAEATHVHDTGWTDPAAEAPSGAPFSDPAPHPAPASAPDAAPEPPAEEPVAPAADSVDDSAPLAGSGEGTQDPSTPDDIPPASLVDPAPSGGNIPASNAHSMPTPDAGITSPDHGPTAAVSETVTDTVTETFEGSDPAP